MSARQQGEEPLRLETARLELVPLTVEQLRLWVTDLPALERQLDCRYRAEPLEGLFLEIVKGQAEKAAEDEANRLYHTFWLLIRKDGRPVVGSICFKGTPDAAGEVEIGYGLGREYEHNGYMTEAVKGVCGWVLKQQGVRHVVAETDIDGFASRNLLQRCGFSLFRQAGSCRWRL